MPQIEDYTDFTIRWVGHPKYNPNKIIETDVLEVIVQKLEMILFTNKGDVWGTPNLGADLEFYLWKTRLSNNNIRETIVDQINEYVPELNVIGYDLSLDIYEGAVRDILYINITVHGYNISYVFE